MAVKKMGILAVLALNGCSTLELSSEPADTESQKSEYAQNSEDDSLLNSSIVFQKQFNLQRNTTSHDENSINYTAMRQDVNDYAKALMQDLVSNLHQFNSSTPVAVVSFVMLDGDYNSSNIVGNQIAESLIHEVHNFGIPVIDFKTTGFIRVTPEGDFAFSKNHEDLSSEMAAQYIIGGTMLKHKDGYLVNARIVSMESKIVIASAQSLIPNNIVNALLPGSKSSHEMQTVQLLQDNR